LSVPKQVSYTKERINHWDSIARDYDKKWKGGAGYHKRLKAFFQYLIPPGAVVLELGCGQGDLLAAVKPSCGVGVDISKEMISRAKEHYPELTLIQADVHALDLDQKFDYIILSDLINDLWNVQGVFHKIKTCCHSRTRLLINSYSRVWSPVLSLTSSLNLSKPNLPQNWFTPDDINNLLTLEDFEPLRIWREILFPINFPLVEPFFNKYLVKFFPFHFLALTNVIMARPLPNPSVRKKPPKVSVVIPARNEAGNIPEIFTRVPQMGSGTEMVFVEGHSKDDTYATIGSWIAKNPDTEAKLFKQTGTGKGDAVRTGFANSSGEVLMILDADLTVAPEDLPAFFHALVNGKGDFINGVRLVYPMESEAMRSLNLVGNKAFSVVFRWALGQPVKDTLCGTKVLWKEDYERIAANRSYFGEFDPFGDYDLLLGADKLGLKIIDLPIRYRDRVYGTTNIQRWKHGWMLLKMVFFAMGKIKFV